MRTEGSPQQLERIRLVTAKLFEEDRSCAYIAQLLGVNDRTVRAWKQVYKKHGRDGLKAKPDPGPPTRLTSDQRGELAALLPQ